MENRNLEQLQTIANACSVGCNDLATNGELIDTLYMQAEAGQLNAGDGTMVVDNALNTESINPVQNKVIARLIPEAADSINKLADKKYVNDRIAAHAEGYVAKEDGKGLSSCDFTLEDAEYLNSLENYDDSELRNQIINKVDKVEGKGLSTNDFTNEYKTKLDELTSPDTNNLQSLIASKADVNHTHDEYLVISDIDGKVDKIEGKGLSTNDYTDEEKAKVEALDTFGESFNNQLANKVDKIEGKGLSTNDYTTEEKEKLAGLSNFNDSSLRELIAIKADVNHSHTEYIERVELERKVDKEDGKGLSTNDFTNEHKTKLETFNIETVNNLQEQVDDISEIVYNGFPAFKDYFNTDTITKGKIILQSGELVDNVNWFVSDYISCKPGDIIHGNSSNRIGNIPMIAIYDEDKNLLETLNDDAVESKTSGKCVITNERAAYFRMNHCSTWFGFNKDYNFAVIERDRQPNVETLITIDKNADDSEVLICSNFWKGMSLAYTIGNCTVLVKGGEYDLCSATPSGLLNEYVVSGAGLFIGRNIKLIGENRPLIKFVNTDRTNVNTPNMLDNFSILNTTGSCRIEGIDFLCENIRYCIHDDIPVFFSNLSDINEYPKSVNIEYIDCNMTHLGTLSTTYTASRCIGGGTTGSGKYIIKGGTYNCVNTKVPISFHNQGLFPVSVETVYISRVNFAEGNYLNGYGMSDTGSIVRFLLEHNNLPFAYAGNKRKIIVENLVTEDVSDIKADEVFFTGKYYMGKPVYGLYIDCAITGWVSNGSSYKIATSIKGFDLPFDRVIHFNYGLYSIDDSYYYTELKLNNDNSPWFECSVRFLNGVSCLYADGKADYDYNNFLNLSGYMEFTLK